jgi:PAS domain S-box-containing protein
VKALSQIRGYGLAAISCGLALALSWWLDAPASCFFVVVMVSSLYCGKGPGLFSVGFSALAFDYFFLPPRFHFYMDASSLLRFGPFLGAALLIVVLIEAKRRGEEARRKIAAQVQRSEAYLAEAQKLSRSGSWASAADRFDATYWSEEMFRIVGLPPSEFPPSIDEVAASFAPADWARMVEMFQAARVNKTTLDGEFPLLPRDGVKRIVHVVGHPILDPSGEILEFVGTAIDITEQREARAALQRAFDEIKRSEDRLRLIIDTIPVPVWSSRPDGSSAFINQRWLDYTGLPVEEALGWDWKVVMHPDDLDRTMEYWRSVLGDDVLAKHEERELEARMLRFDGIYRWFLFRVSALRDESGRIVQWYGTCIDIEDRKRAEESLRRRERDLFMIVETMPGLVWCAGANGELTYVNRRILDYIGTNVEALAQAGWLNFLHPDDVPPTIHAWTHAVETREWHEIQYRLRRFDGAYRWFHVLGQPAGDMDGHSWYGLLIDIDDRKNMEEALRTTQARLSRAAQTATVGELAASIAHEINQPLAAVVANGHACLRWLAAQPPNLAKAQEAAERIVRDGKDAGEIIQRIRALFKRTSVEKTALDLNEVITEVLRLTRSEVLRRGVAVETELQPGLPCVTGDRVQLQQLLLNLLANGIEAMDGAADQPKRLFIRSQRQVDEGVLVEVRDCGPGLAEPDKVFEAFFTTKENGLGMGLAICRSIVEAHQGRLWAESAHGTGAAFCFTLPDHASKAS